MDISIDEKLRSLTRLQHIHSKLDRINQILGGLPEEVRDLEDDLEGRRIRTQKITEEVHQIEREIADKRQHILSQKDLIKRYQERLNEVRNNREFESLTHEVQLAELEIQTAERRIRFSTENLEERTNSLSFEKNLYQERLHDLDAKKLELSGLVAENEAEASKLESEAVDASKQIEPRLLKAYSNVRNNMRNGLAVVSMDRDACGGCFSVIPPQRRAEIRHSRRIIVCENCGRILVDASYFPDYVPPAPKIEEVPAPKTRRRASTAKTVDAGAE
ncbi:MAG: C4-type zinc ribbon domain-containing protein [Bacteroidia bacterium]|nr:C4-type zinc ribbon domain-containing protein [Bacteroidia bacterium]